MNCGDRYTKLSLRCRLAETDACEAIEFEEAGQILRQGTRSFILHFLLSHLLCMYTLPSTYYDNAEKRVEGVAVIKSLL